MRLRRQGLGSLGLWPRSLRSFSCRATKEEMRLPTGPQGAPRGALRGADGNAQSQVESRSVDVATLRPRVRSQVSAARLLEREEVAKDSSVLNRY